MALFDDFDWGALLKGVANTAISSAPAILASNRGARTVAAGNEQAMQIAQQAGVANEALIREQMARNDAAVRTATSGNAPALAHFRTTMAADPSTITPAQQIAIDDSTRTLKNQNVLGTVGGRALSRMVADTSGRLRANALQQNQQRSDAAAGQVGAMSGQNAGLTLQGAGLNNQATNSLVQNQNAVATNVGNAVTSNAQVAAEPYGQIANFFANSMKDEDRKSRYEEYKTARV